LYITQRKVMTQYVMYGNKLIDIDVEGKK